MTSKIGSNGFTLIEVLVASVILFAGLGAVLKAYSLAVVAMDSAADKLAICQIIQEKAAELDVQVADSSNGLPAGQGREKVGGREYLWQVRTSQQALTPEVYVLKAAIEVTRGSVQANICQYEWAKFREKEPIR